MQPTALIKALKDEDTNVRYHAIEALGKLKAVDAVDALAEIAESRDFFLAFAALDALAKIGDARIAPTNGAAFGRRTPARAGDQSAGPTR